VLSQKTFSWCLLPVNSKGRHCSVWEGRLGAECDSRTGRGRGLTTVGSVPQCLSKETRADPVTVT